MSKIPVFTGPDGMPVQPTEDHYRQAIALMAERVEQLETYLGTLHDTTPHQWLKKEIEELLYGMG